MTDTDVRLGASHASAYLKNAIDSLKTVASGAVDHDRATLLMVMQTLTRTSLHLDPEAYGIDLDADAGESQVLDAIEQTATEMLAALNVAPESGGRDFDESALLAYLQAHPRGGSKLTIRQAKLLAGGRSKQTILLVLEGANDLPTECVLRRDWASSVTGTSVVSEFELLKAAFENGIKVPEPVLLEKSPDALGAPFIIVKRVDGVALGDPFTPPDSRQPVLDVAEQLGKLHSLDTNKFSGLDGVMEDNLSPVKLREKLTGYITVIRQFGSPCEAADQALEWLNARVDAVECQPAIVHADLGFHNMLCDQDRLVAILDWELAHVGNPALDLGYLRSVVTQRVDWAEFIAAYQAAGGKQLSPMTVDFFTLFASIWLYQLLLQARAAITSRQVADMEITHVCSHFLPALQARISRELRNLCTTW